MTRPLCIAVIPTSSSCRLVAGNRDGTWQAMHCVVRCKRLMSLPKYTRRGR